MATVANTHLIPPKKPSWRRFIHVLRSPYTLYRTLEYEIIRETKISGRILDVGGGEKTSYFAILNRAPESVYESINAAEDIAPTYKADLNEKMPIADGLYDTAVSFNTFEHIYKIDFVLSETARILKSGGTAFIAVPFMFRVHGSPDDFHRKTPSWWSQKMQECGFDPGSITIEPIIWDVWSIGFSLTERIKIPLVPYRLRRLLALLPGLIQSTLRFKNSGERIPDDQLDIWQALALGYVIKAKKK